MKLNKALIIALAGTAFAGVAVLVYQQRKRRTLPGDRSIRLNKSITVDRPAKELYRHWRNLESLPCLIGTLESVEVEDATHSSWRICLPGGLSLRWNSEITEDRENEMIAWRSLENSDIDVSGFIRFDPVHGGESCIVRVALQYNRPVGKLGALAFAFAGERPGALIEETLLHFKQRMETGEVAPANGKTKSRRADAPNNPGDVQSASEDSFPASDPPAWTGTTGTAGT